MTTTTRINLQWLVVLGLALHASALSKFVVQCCDSFDIYDSEGPFVKGKAKGTRIKVCGETNRV